MSSQLGFLIPSKNFSKNTTPEKPDYSEKNFWAALPSLDNDSNLIPTEYFTEGVSKKADCFFVHPTGFFLDDWNGDISKMSSASDRVRLTLATQASAFNEGCEIYAPFYRQATYSAIVSDQGVNSIMALDLAYEDVLNSFKHYRENYNKSKPLVLAAHSQGALHCQRLLSEPSLKEFFKENLVAAYLIGYPLDAQIIKEIGFKTSSSPDDINCIVQYGAVGEGARNITLGGIRERLKFWLYGNGGYHLRGVESLTSTNPAMWQTSSEWQKVPANSFIMPKIKGQNIFFDFSAKEACQFEINNIRVAENQDIEARVRADGLLETRGNTIQRILKKNVNGSLDLHIWDYQLFWGSIRANASNRISKFLECN
ncbi:DUF3089 domain-containing protein [Bacteroidota bacterium]|nr:DUF3089 domain-containing protein [Bacteroidota bacterium]